MKKKKETSTTATWNRLEYVASQNAIAIKSLLVLIIYIKGVFEVISLKVTVHHGASNVLSS